MLTASGKQHDQGGVASQTALMGDSRLSVEKKAPRIIDSHAYCFQPIDRPAGHPSGASHLKWVQTVHGSHHQPAWRLRDRAPASSQVIAPSYFQDLTQLPDVNFRADRQRGRVVWTIKGEDYTKQFFPPNLRDLEFTPHSLIGEMDYAGVDLALLHTDPMLGRESDFQAECMSLYPDRLRSMAPVDEWRIRTSTDHEIKKLRRAFEELSLHALKFDPGLAYLDRPDPWDDGVFRPFWEAATSFDIPVFFTIGTGPEELEVDRSVEEVQRGYLSELRILMRWMERYPDTVCSLTHGFPWRLFLDDDQIRLPEAIWEPFRNSKCHLEISFPVRLGDLFDYPYRKVWPTMEQLVERIGADQLLWGTDMPFQNRFCTYRQSRNWIEEYCRFLSQEDLDKIMGGTISQILDLHPEG